MNLVFFALFLDKIPTMAVLTSDVRRRPTSDVRRRTAADPCRRPASDLCRRLGSDPCRRSLTDSCRRPASDLCLRPASDLCRRPTSNIRGQPWHFNFVSAHGYRPRSCSSFIYGLSMLMLLFLTQCANADR